MSKSVFIVSAPDYDGENIDSIWLTEIAALRRVEEIGEGHRFIQEYKLEDHPSWIRNGWYPPMRDPKCWSDWGYTGKRI